MWKNHSEKPERISILPRSIQVQEQRSHPTYIQNIICSLRSNRILKGTEHHESWALEHLQIWELLSLNNGTLMFFCYFFLHIRWMYFSFFTYQVERLETSLFADNKTLYFLCTFKWKYVHILFSLYNFKGSFLPLWIFHFFFSILEVSDF